MIDFYLQLCHRVRSCRGSDTVIQVIYIIIIIKLYHYHYIILYPFFSHTGNVRILEVNPDGNYVRVFNTSSFKVS